MKNILLMLGACCGLVACGGNYTQATARDMAVEQSCDWYASCDQIGAGKQYADRDQCEVAVRAYWNAQWAQTSCDNKIRPADLESCLTAIENTQCGNGLDLANTVFNKCGQAQVCQG